MEPIGWAERIDALERKVEQLELDLMTAMGRADVARKQADDAMKATMEMRAMWESFTEVLRNGI